MKPSSTFIFAGGGTGGHLFPGIAVARELRRREPTARMLFVGSTREIESAIVADQGIEHRPLNVEPLPTLRRNPWQFIRGNWQAWRAARTMLRSLRPNAVIGLGGYASAPLVWEASRQGIPVILLEQNVIPGRTTRWLARFADRICVSFDETRLRLPHARRVIVTGNPVRAAIVMLGTLGSDDSLSHDQAAHQPELLILGGSQGADSLNEAVLAAIRQSSNIVNGWTIVHQTGPRYVDLVRQVYQEQGCTAEVDSFFYDLPKRYASASLVVSRAGATTLAELACAGLAMILLPFPHAADDHQRANAQVFVHHDAAVMVEHAATPESTANQLVVALKQLVGDEERRSAMGLAAKGIAHPDAAQRIADVIDEVVGENRTK